MLDDQFDDLCAFPPFGECAQILLDVKTSVSLAPKRTRTVGVQNEEWESPVAPAPSLPDPPSPKDTAAAQYYTHCVELHRLLRELAASHARRTDREQRTEICYPLPLDPPPVKMEFERPKAPPVSVIMPRVQLARKKPFWDFDGGVLRVSCQQPIGQQSVGVPSPIPSDKSSAAPVCPEWIETLVTDNAKLCRQVRFLTDSLFRIKCSAPVVKSETPSPSRRRDNPTLVVPPLPTLCADCQVWKAQLSTRRKLFDDQVRQLERQIRHDEEIHAVTLCEQNDLAAKNAQLEKHVATLTATLHTKEESLVVQSRQCGELLLMLEKNLKESVPRCEEPERFPAAGGLSRVSLKETAVIQNKPSTPPISQASDLQRRLTASDSLCEELLITITDMETKLAKRVLPESATTASQTAHVTPVLTFEAASSACGDEDFIWVSRKEIERTQEKLRIESVLRNCADSYAHLAVPEGVRVLKNPSTSIFLSEDEKVALLRTLTALGGDVTPQSVDELLYDPGLDSDHAAQYHLWIRETFLKE